MAESSYDYLKNRDKLEKENNPWLEDFNYEETVTPEALLNKIKAAIHKVNPKDALNTITSNASSKLNVSPNKETKTDISLTDSLEIVDLNAGEISKESDDKDFEEK